MMEKDGDQVATILILIITAIWLYKGGMDDFLSWL